VLTDEDLRKTEQYLENSKRAETRAAATDLSAYLESLQTTVTFAPADGASLPRIHQLFSKTNQFNLTTKRYSLAELTDFAASDDCTLETVSVSDAFGQLGTVGVYLLRFDGRDADIDSFVLSCRAMGREIETAMCNRIKQRARDAGAAVLHAHFAPTRKNRPAEQFYDSQEFQITAMDADNHKRYRLDVAAARPLPCSALRIIISKDRPHE
jgi:FkbH-like protein